MIKNDEIETLIDSVLEQAIHINLELGEVLQFGVLLTSNATKKNIHLHDIDFDTRETIENLKAKSKELVENSPKYKLGVVFFEGLYLGKDAFIFDIIGDISEGWMRLILPYTLLKTNFYLVILNMIRWFSLIPKSF